MRVRKASVGEDLVDGETPRCVDDETPKSPKDDTQRPIVEGTHSLDDDELYDDLEADPAGSGALIETQVALTWHGHSAADLETMWRMARDSRNAGALDEAENMFQQTLIGMNHVRGKTNEDTVKVAYNLADLYADSGRMEDAVGILEKVIQNHISRYGLEDAKTQQNVLHAVELLNGWNRHTDALSLLSLAKELLGSSSSARNPRVGERFANRKRKAIQKSFNNNSQTDISRATESVLENASPDKVDYGLIVARTHVAAKDRSVEGLLLATISQCEHKPDLSVQYLKAHAELLKLYESLGQADKHEAAFENALASLKSTWEAYKWEEKEIERFDFMEAALQLINNIFKCGYHTQAWPMFRAIADTASNVFGYDDERTVWILISIGLVYQTHMTWDSAEQWFDEAFAAALANKAWGPKDGIVRSLENAREHHHFSYTSDEGRPYKTIFGVSGITIRPGRLHLE